MIHDPREVAHVAAVIISATGNVEPHHIKGAVEAARCVLAEAHRRADEDESSIEAKRAAAAAAARDAGEVRKSPEPAGAGTAPTE